MGEYQADAGPMDALRAHLRAIRTEAARIEPGALRVAVLDARERLARRPEALPEPLPERIAALHSRVTAKLEELEGALKPPREPQSAADSSCNGFVAIADAAYELADESTDFEEARFWYQLYLSALDSYADCEGL
jgi:hypothetical protein